MQIIRNPKEMLSKAGIVATPARVNILDICIRRHEPMEVAQVASYIGNKAHLATVYRTLEKFVSAGILERINFQEGKFRYEYVHDHHHHAICDNCQSVVEIHDQAFEKQIEKISITGGFNITRHSIEFFGLCGPCQKKGNYAN